MVRRDLQSHENESCPEKLLSCELMGYGCTAVFKRKDAEKHAREHAGRHVAMLTGRIKKMESWMQKMSEERGAHIVWRLTADEVRSRLRPSAYLYSDWCLDSEGVRWRIKLRLAPMVPTHVAAYVQPDRVPTEKKCYRISLKQPYTTRQDSHKWEAPQAGNARDADSKKEKSESSTKEEEKANTREEKKEEKEAREENEERKKKAENPAAQCAGWGWCYFVSYANLVSSRDIELDAKVYTQMVY